MKLIKRTIAMMLTVIMLIGLLPMNVLAADGWTDPGITINPGDNGGNGTDGGGTKSGGGTVTLVVGETVTLDGGWATRHSWSTSASGVASLPGGNNKEQNVTVTAVAPGTSTVKDTHRIGSESYTVNVLPALTVGDVTLYEGETKTASATSNPTGTISYTIAQNEGTVATISGNQIYGVARGEAELKASVTVNGKTNTRSARITVLSNVQNISAGNISIYSGETGTLTASYTTASETGRQEYPISWAVKSGHIELLSTSGNSVEVRSTGNEPETAVVTVTVGSVSKDVDVTVLSNVTGITGTAEALYAGETKTASVALTFHDPEGKTDYPISWTVKSGEIELLSDTGESVQFRSTGYGAGSAVLTASAGGRSTDIPVTINGVGFTLAANPETIAIGASGELVVTSQQIGQAFTGVEWVISDESKLSISGSGTAYEATGTLEGDVTVKALVTYQDHVFETNEITLTVVSNVSSFGYTKTAEHNDTTDPKTELSETIAEGTEYNFHAAYTLKENASVTPTVRYGSGNDSVSVTDNGNGDATIKARAIGNCDVTVTCEGITAVDHLTVISNIEKVNIPTTLTLYKGMIEDIDLFGDGVQYVSNNGRKLSRTEGDGGYEHTAISDDQTIAAISEDGVIDARAVGSTVITVTIDGEPHFINVEVKDGMTDFSVPETVTLDVTEGPETADLLAQMTITYIDDAGSLQTCSYAEYLALGKEVNVYCVSENQDIATVNASTGIVTAVKKGFATVTVEAEGIRKNVLVTVNENGEAPEPDDTKFYTVTVRFVYGDDCALKGQEIYSSWSGDFAAGSAIDLNVDCPTNVPGFVPDVVTYKEKINYLTSSIERTVYYHPGNTTFTVNYWLEGAKTDTYVLDDTAMITAKSEDSVRNYISRFDIKNYPHYNKLSYNRDEVIAANGSTVINIYYNRSYYLVLFELNGGTGVKPVYERWGYTFPKPADPVRAGYSFAGWYEDADLTVPVDFDEYTVLQRNVTYYAKWNAATADYKVIHWLEKSDSDDANNPDNYNFEEHEVKTGTAGTYTNATAKTYTGFNSPSGIAQLKIMGDGSTVVNIYYTRKTYTLTFKDGNRTVATISGKYNAYIADEFSRAPFTTTYNGRAWKATDTQVYSYALQTLDRMPAADVTFNLYQKSSSTEKTIHYYVQKLGTNVSSSTWPTSTANFDLLKNVKTYFNYITYTEEYHEIEGFTRYAERTAGFSDHQKSFTNNQVSLFYLRNKYTLTYINRSSTYRTESIEYQAPLTDKDYQLTSADRPAELGPEYEFKGWYKDPDCKVKFKFEEETMPSANLAVYAKWVPKTVTLTVYSKMIEGNYKTFEVPYGTVFTGEDPAWSTPDAPDCSFVGWFYNGAGETPFSFAIPITEDTTVVAKFKYDREAEVIINYLGDDGTVIAPTKRENLYEGSSKTYLAEPYLPGGYYPYTSSQAIILNGESTEDVIYTPSIDGQPATYEYTFRYQATPEVPYTVHYLENGSGEILHEAVTKVTGKAVITESYISINGYKPLTRQQTFTLTADPDKNHITFYYVDNSQATTGDVQIIHWKWNGSDEQSKIKVSEYDRTNIDIGTVFDYTDEISAPSGYVFDKAVCDPSNCKVTADGLLIELYYKPADYPYTFFFKKDSVNGAQIAEPVTGTAAYLSGVTEVAKEIPGYTCQNGPTLTINIKIDPEGRQNQATFIYTENTVSIKYVSEDLARGTVSNAVDNIYAVNPGTGKPVGSIATPKNGWAFIGWYLKDTDTKVGDDPAFVPARNNDGIYESATYEARFEQRDAAYTVNYYLVGTTESVKASKSGTAQIGSGVTETAPEIAGYTAKAPTSAELTVKADETDNVINFYYYKDVTVTAANKSKVYGAADPELTATVTGTKTGETVIYSLARVPGENAGQYDITPTGDDIQGYYKVTYVPAVFTISAYTGRVVVTVTENGNTVTYTGEEQSVTGYTSAITTDASGLYQLSYVQYKGTDADKTAKGTDAGRYDMGLTAAMFENTNTNFTNVLFVIVDGKLVIEPAEYWIETDSATKAYDGTALTAGASVKGLVNGETATVAATGSRTEVGSSDNTYGTVTWGSADSKNYTHNSAKDQLGTLTVTQNTAAIKVTVKGFEVTYDGTEHAATYSVSGVPEGFTAVVTLENDKLTDVGSDTAKVTSVKIMKGSEEVTSQFKNIDATSTDTVKVNPVAIEITADSASKTYDGTALVKNSYTVTSGALVGNDKISVTVTGSQTEVGSSANTASNATVTSGKQANYSFTYKPGTLTVTQNTAAIKVTVKGFEVTYDGTEHAATYSVSGVPDGFTAVVTLSNDKLTDVGSDTAKVASVKIMKGSADVTNQFKSIDATSTDTVKVNPVAIEITADSDTKPYDGTALVKNSYTITSGALVGTDTIEVTVTGSQTEVGESNNVASNATVTSGKQANYSFTYKPGTLTVTQNTAAIKVTVTGFEVTYDGTEHAATYSVSGVPEGFTAVVTLSNDKLTDVGSDTAKVASVKIMKGSADVTNQFKSIDATSTDTVKVNPVAIEITADSATKTYDGTALTKDSWKITSGALVGNDKISVTVTGSQTEVGSSANTASNATVTSGKQANYSFTYKPGTLEVTQNTAAIVVTVTGFEVTYDGNEHAATYKVTGVPSGFTYEVELENDKLTDAGTDTAKVKSIKILKDSADVTSQFKSIDSSSTDTVKVNPVAIEITADSATKTYDGTALTKDSWKITSGALVGSDKISVTVSGSQTEVGESNNTASNATVTSGKQANYSFTYKPGTLEVTQNTAAIVVTVTGFEVTYDGNEHAATYSVSGVPTGFTAVVTLSNDKLTDAGSDTAKVASVKIMKGSEDVTSQFKSIDATSTDTVKVNPVSIEITADSATKSYDGVALTKDSWKITSGALVGSDKISVTVSGSQTEVGESNNTASNATVTSGKQANYSFTYKPGTLEVTQNTAAIKVTVTGFEVTYDGNEHAATYSVTGVPEGFTAVVTLSNDKLTDVGSDTAKVASVKIMKGSEDVTSQFKSIDATSTDTVKVNPVAIEITADSDTKPYDGTALVKNSYTITSGALVGTDAISVTVTGSQTEVGSSANTASNATVTSGKQANYSFTYKPGTLTVTQNTAAIKVTVKGFEVTYDGTEHAATYSVSGVPEGFTAVVTLSNDKLTDVGSDTAKVASVKIMKGSADVTSRFANIDATSTDTVKVNPVAIEITADSATKTYDGTALTKDSWKITSGALVGSDAISVTVKGSQTEVGSSANTASNATVTSGKQGNYSFTYKPGTLTVTPYAGEIIVTVTENSDTVTYTGKEQSVMDYTSAITKDASKLYQLDYVNYKGTDADKTAKGTDAGRYDMGLTAAMFENTNANFSNVKFKIVDGKLTIEPAEYWIETETASKVYDGMALTAGASVKGLVNGETATVIAMGSQTDVGSSSNTYGTVTWDTAASKNYTHNTEKDRLGTLTVSEYAGEIVIETLGGSKAYDGTPLNGSIKPFTVPAGYSIDTATTDAKATHVSDGEVNVKVDHLIIRNAAGDDVTENLNINKIETATLQITPIDITVTTGTAAQPYEDGAELTCDIADVTGLIAGETVKVKATGVQTEAGTIPNTYRIEWGKVQATDYVVNEELGTLTLYPRLTIHYVYEDGTPAADDVVGWPDMPGGQTEYVSPVFDKYTADQPIVNMTTLSDTNTDITVTYIGDPFTLTIRYWIDQIGGEAAAETYEVIYRYNSRYDVASPSVKGYHPDISRVQGIMEDDISFDVVYTLTPYKLTIIYKDIDTGEELAPRYVIEQIFMHDNYKVFSPEIDGYVCLMPEVFGFMPARNHSITVYYTAKTDPDNPIDIDDGSVPLAIGPLGISIGECIE